MPSFRSSIPFILLNSHSKNSSHFGWIFFGFLLFVFLNPYNIEAQIDPEYDEITAFFQVQNIGGFEIPVIIKNEVAYLPVKDIFDFLKIKSTISADLNSISGFVINQGNTYTIDYQKNTIIYQKKQLKLGKDDIIRTETNLYLHAKYWGEIFGLECKFDFRNLAVKLTTLLELPVIREMRIDEMRKNINRAKGVVQADTTIGKSRTAFHFGMADWSVVSTQNIGQKSDTRLNLALGAAVAGGEANVYLNYNNKEQFDERQQQYYLKFVNNDRSFLRQTTIGKIYTDATTSLYDPVVGIRLTNTPTTYRQAFGTYPLSDYTNPGWTVELYVNNVLIDFLQADASGFFTFQVPLVYGNSMVKLKFYGPWGEERAKEQTIVVPFNFLPANEFEYTINAGFVEDGKASVFSRGSLKYGLNKSITIGTGVEYLSSLTKGKAMPFVTLMTRPLPSMIIAGDFIYGVRAKGIASYQFPKNIQIELNYTKYVPGQEAITFNYLEERKAIFTLPIKAKSFTLYNRMSFDQILLPGTQYATSEWLISGSVFGVNTNLTNYAMFYPASKPYLYSDLSLSVRTKTGLTVIPQIQFEYSAAKLISAKLGLEKYFFKNGFLSLSYENNFKGRLQVVQMGMRYEFSFMQTGFTARQANRLTTIMELARGSLLVDQKSHYVGANNRTGVGRGGIVFAPYLDINFNNRFDKDEPRVDGLNIHASGGKTEFNFRDSTVRVTDLEPYIYCIVELDPNSFENVSWKLPKKTLKILVDPNQLKLVEIPIIVAGEVSGTITKVTKNESEGIGRILLNIFDKSGTFIAKTMTEQDGYYSYLGLPPGNYYAQVDTLQLKKIHLEAEPVTLPFTIHSSRDGDIVEGIDFVLKSTIPTEQEPEIESNPQLPTLNPVEPEPKSTVSHQLELLKNDRSKNIIPIVLAAK